MRIIIIGAGEIGITIARKLSQEKKDVTLIEQDEVRLRTIEESLDVQTIIGSGSKPDTLKAAGIESADMLVAVTRIDETNMIACLIADTYNPKAIKIARIRNQDYVVDGHLLAEGRLPIDHHINPERMACSKILRLLEIGSATDVIDFAQGRVNLIGVRMTADSPLVGHRFSELGTIYPDRQVLFGMICRGSRAIIPKGGDRILNEDLLYAVTQPINIPSALMFASKKMYPARRVMIAGGSMIGLLLAQGLEERGDSAKLIERDAQRCEELSDILPRTVVLHGEPTDSALITEENIENLDAFIAVSDDEEENILAALLAKQLGAKTTYALTNKLTYMTLIKALGVDVVISPNSMAINSILHLIRKGRILSATTIGDEEAEAEALEFVAHESMDIVGRPLKKIRFPRGALVGAIVRDEGITIPMGDDVILPNNRVILFATKEAVPDVERVLTVKLEN